MAATCPHCDSSDVVVEMRAMWRGTPLGFIGDGRAMAVVIPDMFGEDVWEVDEVVCESCGDSIYVQDYEVGHE